MPRILLVDDEPKLRAAIRRMLEPMGFEIEEASDGREVSRILNDRPADLLITDLFMPEKDGLEVIRELSRKFPETKIIAMSGGGFKGTLDMLPTAKYFGASAVLHKPFESAALQKAVRKIFDEILV